MMPRILEGFAGKAAAALAQTERREDTELVSFGGVFAYAFVGNFLVLSGDAATTRRVVDSYLKGETLSADSNYRTLHALATAGASGTGLRFAGIFGNLPDLGPESSAQISDEARTFLARLDAAQPITYSLSNDGLGSSMNCTCRKAFSC